MFGLVYSRMYILSFIMMEVNAIATPNAIESLVDTREMLDLVPPFVSRPSFSFLSIVALARPEIAFNAIDEKSAIFPSSL